MKPIFAAAAVVLMLSCQPVLAGDTLFDRLYGDRFITEVPSESYAVEATTYPVDAFDVDGVTTDRPGIYEAAADVNGDGLITEVEAHDLWVAVEAETADDPSDPMVDEL